MMIAEISKKLRLIQLEIKINKEIFQENVCEVIQRI